MKTLVLGGSGYIGSAVIERLMAHGHEPVAVIRPGSSKRASLISRDIEVREGEFSDLEALAELITNDIDAVIDAANPNDWELDAQAVHTLLKPLANSSRPFVYTSGVWVFPNTSGADEETPPDPIAINQGRPRVEEIVLRTPKIHGVVLRPGVVHGHNGGIPARLRDWARAAGIGRYVSDEHEPVWPMVHLDDLADLYVLAVSRAQASSIVHGISEPGVSVKELAQAADVATGGVGAAEAWPIAEARKSLGDRFAEALALHQVVHSSAAASLGWQPRERSAILELREGSYA
ncbi:MAG: NAD-dependent epimerase/dehydratase family protein [Corynebacteriales bacterium]|nr:NAD-dependent epimerase/dehydratase family protein [Mycobacteriales bacterium]